MGEVIQLDEYRARRALELTPMTHEQWEEYINLPPLLGHEELLRIGHRIYDIAAEVSELRVKARKFGFRFSYAFQISLLKIEQAELFKLVGYEVVT